jgi:hypothetical protein
LLIGVTVPSSQDWGGCFVDGYQAIIDEIRTCGRHAVTAGEDTRKVDLPAAVAGVEPALPGSASATAARGLSTMWESRLRLLSDDVVRLGTGLEDTADQYARDDHAAEANLDSVEPRYRRYE